MVKSRPSNLHQSAKIVPRDRVKRECRQISSVPSWIDVSNSQIALQILAVITPQMNGQD